MKKKYFWYYSSLVPSCFLPWHSWQRNVTELLVASSTSCPPLLPPRHSSDSVLPSPRLRMVPPPRKRFYSTWNLLPSWGSEHPRSSRICSDFSRRPSRSLWHHLLSEDACLIHLSTSPTPTTSSTATAQSRIWHAVGTEETFVQLLNEPVIFSFLHQHGLHWKASFLARIYQTHKM